MLSNLVLRLELFAGWGKRRSSAQSSPQGQTAGESTVAPAPRLRWAQQGYGGHDRDYSSLVFDIVSALLIIYEDINIFSY